MSFSPLGVSHYLVEIARVDRFGRKTSMKSGSVSPSQRGGCCGRRGLSEYEGPAMLQHGRLRRERRFEPDLVLQKERKIRQQTRLSDRSLPSRAKKIARCPRR